MKGILIAGYGTRTGNLTTILENQAARLRARGRKNIYVGYFRVSHPTIPEALSQMVEDGVDDVLVLPYYIAEGKLTQTLIPEKLGLSSRSGAVDVGGKRVRVTEEFAFGYSYVTTHILCDRIAEAGGNMETSGILVIGHGSREGMDCNYSIIAANAERLKKIGYKHVAFAFNEFCEPDIGDGVEQLVREGADEIVVVPAFIANGVHLGEEIAEKLKIPNYSDGGEAEFASRRVKVKYMRGVEDDPRLLELLDAKVAEFYGE